MVTYARAALRLLAATGTVFALSACNYYELKAGKQSPAMVDGSPRTTNQYDFAAIRTQIIAPSCLGCHGGRVQPSLTNYSEVKANIGMIKNKVIDEQSMPPSRAGGALSPQLQSMLSQWIAAGAPETLSSPRPSPSATPSPSPVPTVFPGIVDYAVIRTQIIEPSCIRCHGGNHAPILNTYADVKSHLSAIEAAVITNKIMPKSGPLSPQLQNLLAQWIAAGAPDSADGTPTTPSPTPTPVPSVSVTPSPAPSTGPTAVPPGPIASPGPGPTSAPTGTPSTTPPQPSPTPFPGILRPVRFTELKKQVIMPNCAECHYAGNDEGNTDLTDYDSFMSVVDFIEGLTTGVAHLPGGDVYVPPSDRMPPSYAPQLSREQKALIMLWLQDGKLGPEAAPTTPSATPLPAPSATALPLPLPPAPSPAPTPQPTRSA